MRSPSVRSIASATVLLEIGLLAIGLVKLGPGPLLAHKPSSEAKTPAANRPQVVEAYGKLPLSFKAHQGQTDSRVKFLSRRLAGMV